MKKHPRSQPLVCHLLHRDEPGGGPVSVAQQVRWFHEAGITQVVMVSGDGPLSQCCRELGVRVVQIPVGKPWLACLVGIWMLGGWLLRLRPDVVILHGQWMAPLGAPAARLTGVRKIIYIARWPSFYTDWDLFRVIRNFLCEWIPCRLASRVICLNEASRRHFIRLAWREPETFQVIPNSSRSLCPMTPKERADFRHQVGMSTECFHVVSLGRLETQKRLDWLVQAWAEVVRQPLARPVHLWIVGEGSLRGQLEDQIQRLHLTESVSLIGAVPEGHRWLGAADLVVMTTMYESFGNVAIEALSQGVPLVANRVDGVFESLADHSLVRLVPPADPQTLASAILLELGSHATRSPVLPLKEFSEAVVRQRWLDLIQPTTSASSLHAALSASS